MEYIYMVIHLIIHPTQSWGEEDLRGNTQSTIHIYGTTYYTNIYSTTYYTYIYIELRLVVLTIHLDSRYSLVNFSNF